MDGISDREAVVAALDAMEAAFDKLVSLSFDGLTSREMVALLARREILARRQPVVDHALINRLAAETSPKDLGFTTLPKVLAHHLRIGHGEAKRRVDEAADLGAGRTLTGQPLEPKLSHLASAQAHGLVGTEHIAITREFFAKLPDHVDARTRAQAERDLADAAAVSGPAEYGRAVRRLALLLDQDGEFTDRDRARRRGIRIGKQGADGLSPITGTLTPEGRAVLEPILAKFGAPGMCNPDDPAPRVKGTPTDEQIRADHRTPDQRNHDALLAAGRIALASRELGRLNGLPVTVIVSTTLRELESAAGYGVTAGGTMLPMADLIRLASHAHHYLVIYDDHNIPLYLGRAQRTASAGQRIVLHNLDRGCTAPGCTASAYQSQAHHITRWSAHGPTDITNLGLACGADNHKEGPRWLPHPTAQK